jgi:aldehyde dehydrogenase (NAD+)
MKPKRAWPTMTMLGTKARIFYEPRGVALIIAPWNYPVSLLLGPLASAIAAGCTAILKPSEMSPASSAVITKMIGEAFAPDEIAAFEGMQRCRRNFSNCPSIISFSRAARQSAKS